MISIGEKYTVLVQIIPITVKQIMKLRSTRMKSNDSWNNHLNKKFQWESMPMMAVYAHASVGTITTRDMAGAHFGDRMQGRKALV